MHGDTASGMRAPGSFNKFRPKAGMDGAAAGPEQKLGLMGRCKVKACS
jgi:hypothetical protein